jgi:hypothetical protein
LLNEDESEVDKMLDLKSTFLHQTVSELFALGKSRKNLILKKIII